MFWVLAFIIFGVAAVAVSSKTGIKNNGHHHNNFPETEKEHECSERQDRLYEEDCDEYNELLEEEMEDEDLQQMQEEQDEEDYYLQQMDKDY